MKFVLVLFVLLSTSVWLGLVQAAAGNSEDQCHPWSFYNDTLHKCQCYKRPEIKSVYIATRGDFIVQCSSRRVLMNAIFCMTNEEAGTFIANCHTYSFNPNTTLVDERYVQLPNNVSDLNDFMCGPMNRKGQACSECIDGFGPSLTSIGYQCSNCTGAWYGIPLYLLLEFVPITVFYVVVYMFQITMTSSPMTYCLMYSQAVVFFMSQVPMMIFLKSSHGLVIFMKVLLTFHGIWNLDLFRYIMPPFCISPNLKMIHIFFLGYVPAMYPMLLVVLTWLFVQHNLQPLVWVKNKVSCLKTKKNSKSPIIDIFATFFLLSYTKLSFISMSFFASTTIYKANDTQSHNYLLVDPSILFLSKKHIPYMVIAAVVLLIFGLFPALLLAAYPIQKLRSLLLLNYLGGCLNAAVNIFVEKFYNCYRDGLDGGRDMRSFASFHLFIRFLGVFVSMWTISGLSVFMGGCSLLIFLVRPCKENYMNNIDALILALMSLNYFIVCLVLANSIYSHIYIWSTFFITVFPLLIILFYLIPCKYLTELRDKSVYTSSHLWKIFCCCFQDRVIQESELSNSYVSDPDRMVHPNQYPVLAPMKQGNCENDPLLYCTCN